MNNDHSSQNNEAIISINNEINAKVKHYKNVHQNFITITEDKMKLILIKYLNEIEDKKLWMAPFGIFITLLLIPLTTEKFKDAFSTAANAFFIKEIISSGLPEKITIDKSGVNKAGIKAINFQLIVLSLLGCALMQIEIRQIKYLNNIIEQDHRGIKRITKAMMGFKAFHSAEAILAGIELYRMPRKGQHINSENAFAFENFYDLAA
jgi:hypothetical protein